MSQLKRCGIFGYGSLVSPASICRTLGEAPLDMQVCCLAEHERVWDLVDQVIDSQSRLRNAVFLNAAPAKGRQLIGIRFVVEQTRLIELDRRERRYRRAEVSRLLDRSFWEPTYSYFADSPVVLPSDAVVMAGYEALIEDGLLHWGSEFRREFLEATRPHTLPRVEGPYRFAPEV